VTATEAKPNLYVRVWRWEKALYKWSGVKTRKLCKPEREDYKDKLGASKGYKLLSRTYYLRSGLGYLIWVFLSVRGYLASGQEITTLGQNLYVLASYWMILPCIVAVSVVLFVITKPSEKGMTLRRLAVPITRVLILMPFAGIWMSAIWLASSPNGNTVWGLENVTYHTNLLIDLLSRVVAIVFLIAFPLFLVFIIWLPFVTINLTCQFFYYNFRAIDGHPYLWPITAITSAWATVVFDAVVSGPSRYGPNAHLFLQLITSWGGPVILSAIAVTEMFWLWHYKIRPRDGSLPPPTQPEPKPAYASERTPY
jgi:hypothetical protein